VNSELINQGIACAEKLFKTNCDVHPSWLDGNNPGMVAKLEDEDLYSE